MFQPLKCFLKSVENKSTQILLKDKIETHLGRSPETNITDERCSRNQVSVIADYDSKTVTVKHLGGNPSSVNGLILRKNNSQVLNHSDILEFLIGEYKFKIEFEPSPLSDTSGKRKHETNQENGNVNSKKICAVSMTNNKNTWEKVDDGKLYIFTSVGVKSSVKVAAYDLDGTVIKTKSGRVFPKDKDDWMLANVAVKTKLSKLFGEGFKVIFLTNQAGIGRGKTNIIEFKNKLENIIVALNVPVQAYVATSNSIYRKPAPGMWKHLETKLNDGIKIDMTQSFYVGDAAGRIANWSPGKKKDFSFADRLMALNLKLQFFTPEEHFLNESPGKFTLPLFNPAALNENESLSDKEILSKTKEVVILVGFPGSGKSHFALTHLVPAGYVHVNRDMLGSWQKCVLNMESALAAGRSVVVDNTNPDRESRKRFTERATVACRCFIMNTTIDHVRHNCRFRELTDSKHIPVNDMIINSYKNKYEAPSKEEGFVDIVNINFVPSFSDPELKKLYQMYLLEK